MSPGYSAIIHSTTKEEFAIHTSDPKARVVEPVADWDKFSIDYDRIFLEYPVYVDTLRKMVEQVEHGNESRFADIGCGTGNAIEQVLASFPGAHIIGIDPSEGMRERCAWRFAGNPQVEVIDGGALAVPLEDGVCDYALSSFALHHVHPDYRGQCAREIARVLAPGGMLVYADVFCDVDGPPDDPERAKDIINKMVGAALYCLDHGAFDMAMIMLKSLPADVLADGEYVTTVGTWTGVLEEAGFAILSVQSIEPDGLGTRIIVAERK